MTFVFSTVLLMPTMTINDTVELYTCTVYCTVATVQCVHKLIEFEARISGPGLKTKIFVIRKKERSKSYMEAC